MNRLTLLASHGEGGLLERVEVVHEDGSLLAEEMQQKIWVESVFIRGFEHLPKPVLLFYFWGMFRANGSGIAIDFRTTVEVTLKSEFALDDLRLALQVKANHHPVTGAAGLPKYQEWEPPHEKDRRDCPCIKCVNLRLVQSSGDRVGRGKHGRN